MEFDRAGHVRPGTVGWSGIVSSNSSSFSLNLSTFGGSFVKVVTPPMCGKTVSNRRGPLEKKEAVRSRWTH